MCLQIHATSCTRRKRTFHTTLATRREAGLADGFWKTRHTISRSTCPTKVCFGSSE
uniref:Uncharacterized protein n=1 Tax=Anopheles atroparvus TaxID=41427 RepID=A0AAG5DLU1_ANOAO